MGKVLPFRRPLVVPRLHDAQDRKLMLDRTIEQNMDALANLQRTYDRASHENRPKIEAAMHDIELTIDQCKQLRDELK